MKVTNAVLYADDREMISFALGLGEPQSRYLVRNIVGLDAEELIPRFYAFGNQTRNAFFDVGMKPRDIVMRVVLNPNYRLDETYSEVRDRMYRAISANRTGVVTMHLNSGASTVARISGFITKFEVGHMSNLPEVQITLRCPDPMFRGINPVTFGSPDMSPGNPLLLPDSLSTAPHGFTFTLGWDANVDALTITGEPSQPDWAFTVIPPGGFLADDELHFSSEISNRYLYVIRDDEEVHLMDAILPSSVWPMIFPGQNEFYFLEYSFFDFDFLNGAEYYPAYWGV